MSGSQSTMAEPVAEDSVLKKDSLAALQTLYAAEPKAKEIGDRSKAILIFPNLVKAGFIAGVQGGDGVLIENGKITGVYNNTAVSRMACKPVSRRSRKPWRSPDDRCCVELLHSSRADGQIGMGPSVVVVDAGAAWSATTTTLEVRRLCVHF